jgi:DNA-binding response OmpR family regulator
MTAQIGNAPPDPKSVPAQPAKAQKIQRKAVNQPGAGQRVLLVEDEALVGMMMRDTLTDLGFQVVGPFCKLIDAVEALNTESFEAAVLDVNLRGDTIYALAEQIAGRGIPFIFVTGYGSEAIDARFANIPVLQKPVDRAALRRIFWQ